MNLQINQLVKTLLKKDSLEQCSLEELEQFADRHPYFGAAQLLLTKKLQSENPSRYDEQLQKTFLFFHNPLWVQHLLNGTGNAEIILPDGRTEDSPAPAIAEEEAQEPIVEKSEPAQPDTEPETEEQPVLMATENFIIDTSTEIPNDTVAPDTLAPLITESKEEKLLAPEVKIENELVTDSKHEFVFEPYHTVDYFASQGIQYKADEKPADKLGQQLKSFTDWLKTMKRLPANQLTKDINPVSEQKVEQLAEHSLKEKEIITEAMAEVWEKQGNIVKATEIYHKLSLLDPAKSLYFAAKIDELKKKN